MKKVFFVMNTLKFSLIFFVFLLVLAFIYKFWNFGNRRPSLKKFSKKKQNKNHQFSNENVSARFYCNLNSAGDTFN